MISSLKMRKNQRNTSAIRREVDSVTEEARAMEAKEEVESSSPHIDQALVEEAPQLREAEISEANLMIRGLGK